jgi:hypothetical protein
MSMGKNKPRHFSATQRKMLHILKDRRWHTRDELFLCLDDDLARPQAVNWHLSRIRGLLPRSLALINKHSPKRGFLYRLVSVQVDEADLDELGV